MGGMADEDTMQADQPMDDQQESDESTSIFIPKSALPEGKKYQKGDKIELTVEDVDPESGEVEACIYGQEANKTDRGSMGYEQAFDQAMPEEG